MDEQNKTKSEEKQNQPAELSDQDLKQAAGGVLIESLEIAPNVKWEGPDFDASKNSLITETGFPKLKK